MTQKPEEIAGPAAVKALQDAGYTLVPPKEPARPRTRLGRYVPELVTDRIERNVAPCPITGCWFWLGALHPKGYGRMWDGVLMRQAHRISYAAYRGPIPEGLELDHKCRQRSCVNPDHLEPVTHAENVRRGGRWKVAP